MFESIQEKGYSLVKSKLMRAQYFLNGLQREQLVTQEWLANLDGFLFEIISAKDFFFQSINDKYKLGLTKRTATDPRLLMRCLKCKGHTQAFNVIKEINSDLEKKTWLNRLNMYRNTATHKDIVPVLVHVNIGLEPEVKTTVHLYKDPEKRNNDYDDIDARDYCQQSLEKISDYLLSHIIKISENL